MTKPCRVNHSFTSGGALPGATSLAIRRNRTSTGPKLAAMSVAGITGPEQLPDLPRTLWTSMAAGYVMDSMARTIWMAASKRFGGDS